MKRRNVLTALSALVGLPSIARAAAPAVAAESPAEVQIAEAPVLVPGRGQVEFVNKDGGAIRLLRFDTLRGYAGFSDEVSETHLVLSGLHLDLSTVSADDLEELQHASRLEITYRDADQRYAASNTLPRCDPGVAEYTQRVTARKPGFQTTSGPLRLGALECTSFDRHGRQLQHSGSCHPHMEFRLVIQTGRAGGKSTSVELGKLPALVVRCWRPRLPVDGAAQS